MPPWQATAELIKSEVGGNCVRLTTRRQSDSEDRSKSNRIAAKNSRHPIPQAAQLFKPQSCNGGVKGQSPLRSLGGPRGIFSHVREYPPYPVQRLRRCFPAAEVPRLTSHLCETAQETTQRIFQKTIDFFKVRSYT